MKRLQMAGNKPIALIGGGTGMVGDPSGRTDMRQMMTPETIQHNCDCFKEQMSKFIDFSEGKALMVNNGDWLFGVKLCGIAAGGRFLLFRQQHAAGRVLQTEDGEGVKLFGV
jgi:tyrosyl-tRNA synthetase